MERDHWDETLEVFKRMKPPLRPHESEIRVYAGWLRERMEATGLNDAPMVDVLLFGVTVEIAAMDWPANVRLTAVDRSEGMIREFWPGDIPGRRQLVRADWDVLPFEPESFHFAVGDGFLNARAFPEGYREFGARIRALLKPNGLLFVRVFTQADNREDPDALIAACRSGGIGDYYAFRFRFLTSLQSNAREGVLASKEVIDAETAKRGFAPEEQYAIMGYEPPKPSTGTVTSQPPEGLRVSYPTADEFAETMSAGFRCVGRRFGDHPLARRCPVFGLARDP